MGPSAKSLILDLLSTLRRGAMPVRALVAAGRLFGLEEGNVRVALARLLAAGLVERDERGRYRLATRSLALQRQLGAWRTGSERTRPWREGWLGVALGGLAGAERASRRRAGRALRFLGFRTLVRGLEIRPDNLTGGIGAARATLAELGLPEEAVVFSLAGLEPRREARARSLWDVKALQAAYRLQRRALERSQRRLPRLAESDAMTESFLVGGRALRLLALDPLLPEAILEPGERDALVAAMRRYDALGRACWAPFLEAHGVLGPHTPADLRMDEAGAGLEAAAGGGFA